MIRLVLSDMDGTLLHKDKPQVTEFALSAIRDLVASGVRFGPASGRDLDDVATFFGGNESYLRTGIFSNGQKIRVDGSWKKVIPYDRDALLQLKKLIDQTPGTMLCVPQEGGPMLVMGPARERTGEFPPSWFPTGVELCDALPQGDVAKAGIACFGSREHCDEVMASLAQAIPQIRFVPPLVGWFDMVVPGWSKAEGLTWLCGHLGIGLDEVCVFGDSGNDVEMLELVPNSVAVGDATPQAAAAARWHIGPANEDSVARALLDIAEAARSGGMPQFMQG